MKRLLSISFIILLMVSLISFAPSVLAWEMERPGGYVILNERTENATTNGKASVGLGVHISTYHENEPDYPSYGNDYAKVQIVGTANSRKVIEYGWVNGYYTWFDESWLPNQILLYENEMAYIYMWNKVRFYGGPGSAEYDSVYVSSNGWLSFDSAQISYPYYTESIPHASEPNNFVAPFWRKLEPSASGYIEIRYGSVAYWPGPPEPTVDCFAISWNAKDIYGNTQTFQVLLEYAPGWWPPFQHPYRQSRIWFQYKTITKTDSTTIGVEDQGGWRGVTYNYQDLTNETNLQFGNLPSYAKIKYLAIRLSENEDTASTDICSDPDAIRGHNVILNQSLPPEDPTLTYATAFAGGATLLLDALEMGATVSGIGLIIGSVLLIVDLASYAAEQQAAASLLQIVDNTYAKATAIEPTYNTAPVDASFCITAYWIFTDDNTQTHSLTITAELTYSEVIFEDPEYPTPTTTISTSVELRMGPDDNNDPGTADPITWEIGKQALTNKNMTTTTLEQQIQSPREFMKGCISVSMT